MPTDKARASAKPRKASPAPTPDEWKQANPAIGRQVSDDALLRAGGYVDRGDGNGWVLEEE